MNKVVFSVGGLLILLGVGMFAGLWAAEGERPSLTALIPAFAGLPIVLLGLLALKDGMRKHAMHLIAALGLLGFLLSAGRLLMQLATGGEFKLTVTVSLLGMAALCGYLVYACVMSFREARKRREEAEAGGDAAAS